jgi:hypothetical protein
MLAPIKRREPDVRPRLFLISFYFQNSKSEGVTEPWICYLYFQLNQQLGGKWIVSGA